MSFLSEHMPFSARGGDPLAGVLSVLLSPAGGLYSLAMKARRSCYASGILESRKPPCRVVSIGNLFAGGGGKTQVASWLAREALNTGVKAAVVSGGYGGSARSSGRAVRISGSDGPGLGGDEAVLLTSEVGPVPVYVSRDRFAGCVKAVQDMRVSLCILDDAAQHLSIARDADVIVTDPQNPFGNGRCLPAGPLRESPSVIRIADLIWLAGGPGAKADMEYEKPLLKFNSTARIVVSATRTGRLMSINAKGETAELDARGLRVLALTGIARPWRFCDSLLAAGATIAGRFEFQDHHAFTARELERVLKKAAEVRADIVVTTTKDSARSGALFSKVLGVHAVLGTSLEIVSGHSHVDWLLKG